MYNANIKTTKKIKRKNKKKISKLWTQFDEEFNSDKQPLELVYSKCETRSRDICDLCQSAVQYTSEGFLGCSNPKCGIVFKDSLDRAAEWRYYGADDNYNTDPTRCGMPINPLLKESSYGCKVVCNGRSTYEMRKIRRYTDWQSMPYKEKSQYDEFERIKIMARNAEIPKLIIDEALRHHKNISELKTFRGCNREGVIAASIYIACRINDYPRTAKEIATIFNLENSAATRGCKNAVQLLNSMEKTQIGDDKTHFTKTKPIAFIERYCSKLNINKELTKVCRFVAMKIEKNNKMAENTPHSVAAGIIYFVSQVCNLNVSKKNVNNVSEISEVTINKCYKKLEKLEKIDPMIPSQIKKKYTIKNRK